MRRKEIHDFGWFLVVAGGLCGLLFAIACTCRVTFWLHGGQDGIFLGEGVIGTWTNAFVPHSGLVIEPPAIPYLWFCRTAGPGWPVWTEKGGIPLWPGMTLAFIGWSLIRFVQPRPAGHCLHCRYNLTGLPPNSPCPECGRARDAQPATQLEGP